MAKKSYEENGVLLSKKTLYKDDKVKLNYNGLLAQSGAQSVFVHIGFGDNWDNSSFIPMKLEDGTFFAELDILDGKSFGICFKDSADNWDNNSGENYVFKISGKPVKKEKSDSSKKTSSGKNTKAKITKTKNSK